MLTSYFSLSHAIMGGISWKCLKLLFLFAACYLLSVSADTDPQDAAALLSLKAQCQGTPSNWEKPDPCGAAWDGITCTNSRVTTMKLSSLGLQGNIDDVGSLTQLQTLDLSSNPNLAGPIPKSIGNLVNLESLILTGCGFTGSIPQELGNLRKLTFLALNSNHLTGSIPPSLGWLSNIYWLDIAHNNLTGPLPVSSDNGPGLDMLLNVKHFNFNNNKLSGVIPPQLFSSRMVLMNILLHENQFTGEIPYTIGLIQTIEVLRLDRNRFSGSVPSSLTNLTRIHQLNLAGNGLTGPVPDLTKMKSLYYMDLSNNSFDASLAPPWFTTIESLTTVVMESGELEGQVPQLLFSLPSLETVRLKMNSFNGTLNMGNNNGLQLQLISLEYNQISNLVPLDAYKKHIELIGNPICTTFPYLAPCQMQTQEAKPYSTSLEKCGNAACPTGQMTNPQSCECAYPYIGTLHFRAVFFSDLSNSTRFQTLEQQLSTQLGLTPGSVYLATPEFDESDHLELTIFLFPSNNKYFSIAEVSNMANYVSSQRFKPPREFGPYCFIATPYLISDGGHTFGTCVIIGIAVGGSLLILLLFAVAIYAIWQKNRAKKALRQTKPFASWRKLSTKYFGAAPSIRGARCFTYDEIKKFTANFSDSNKIGLGGFGQVYKGVLPSGEIVAIKKAEHGAFQGALEFKAEIELLSRVHHKNLVNLVGFCFDHGEQMLVYEYIPNGTLQESLLERSKIRLNWKQRLQVSLDSARGLVYLHEHANPPVIHRDVKSPNILLDENLTAKVSDFGLSKLVSDSVKEHNSGQVKGTLGYLDPEYYMNQKLSAKSDVYSFGVVMLELVTAKKPVEMGKYIVMEVRKSVDKSKEHYGLVELLDPALKTGGTLIGFKRFVDLALRCAEDSGDYRPTMNEVVKEIEDILQNELDIPSATVLSAVDSEISSPRYPHNYPLSSSESHGDTFSCSGSFTLTAVVEPK